ncbi:MAG: phosphorylase family protein [Pirellulales bacterium]
MVLRWVLRSMLHRVAQEKFQEAVSQAAREKMAEAGLGATQEAPGEKPACEVGIVFALSIESGGLVDRLESPVSIQGSGFLAREGKLQGRQVVVVESGPGCPAAARATEALVAGHRPAWVVSAGFAGGLTADLRRGDILLADGVVHTAGQRLSIDLKVDPASLAQSPGLHVGRLLTTDRIIRHPEEKRSLGQAHEALAVDMETWAVAEICRREKVRFLAVRVINDAVDDELPRDVDRLLAQKTPARRLGAAAAVVLRRPSSLKDMYSLRENAILASERLAKFLESMMRELPK